MQAVERGAQSQAIDQGDLWLKPGEAMRPKTATYVTLFDPKKLVNLMSMSDAKCETFHAPSFIEVCQLEFTTEDPENSDNQQNGTLNY